MERCVTCECELCTAEVSSYGSYCEDCFADRLLLLRGVQLPITNNKVAAKRALQLLLAKEALAEEDEWYD